MRNTFQSTTALVIFCALFFAGACERRAPDDSKAAKGSSAQVPKQAATTSAATSSCQQYAEAVCEICGRAEKDCRAAMAKFHKCDQGKNCQHQVCSSGLLELKKNKPEENKKLICTPD